MCYLVLVLAVQLAHLAVHQVLDCVDLSLHLLFSGLQLVLQFSDERFTAAAIQRSLQHSQQSHGVCSYLLWGDAEGGSRHKMTEKGQS